MNGDPLLRSLPPHWGGCIGFVDSILRISYRDSMCGHFPILLPSYLNMLITDEGFSDAFQFLSSRKISIFPSYGWNLCIVLWPGWENLHWLSERLASLGIMGDQLRASLKPINKIVLWCPRGVSAEPIVGLPLRQLYVRSLLFYQTSSIAAYKLNSRRRLYCIEVYIVWWGVGTAVICGYCGYTHHYSMTRVR